MPTQLKECIKNLRLPYMYQNLEEHLEQARLENKTYEDFLAELLQYEWELRQNNGVRNRIRAARFPYPKTLEELEVDSLPEGARTMYQHLRSLDFIKNKQNIILCGNPGTGKTHLAIGLGMKACMEGMHVYFAHVPSLIIELKEAQSNRVLQRLKTRFEKYDLIILDELGYISFDKEGAELLFNFISGRTEHASTVFTTNLSFDRWNEIFHDPIITTAMVDRITHKSYAVNMNGTSYRMKETKDFLNQLTGKETDS